MLTFHSSYFKQLEARGHGCKCKDTQGWGDCYKWDCDHDGKAGSDRYYQPLPPS